jgi:hypothetical protein
VRRKERCIVSAPSCRRRLVRALWRRGIKLASFARISADGAATTVGLPPPLLRLTPAALLLGRGGAA